MGANVWISKWTANSGSGNNTSFLIGYGALAFTYGFFAILRAGALLSGSIHSSRTVHRRMITSLLFAPLNEFFERIPIGRILNRLSKDVSVIDSDLAYTIGIFLATVSTTIGDTLLCVYASSLWVLIPISIFMYACKKL
jgi:ATP-binding cassette subfamily C (CFTR/MRP) protein 2